MVWFGRHRKRRGLSQAQRQTKNPTMQPASSSSSSSSTAGAVKHPEPPTPSPKTRSHTSAATMKQNGSISTGRAPRAKTRQNPPSSRPSSPRKPSARVNGEQKTSRTTQKIRKIIPRRKIFRRNIVSPKPGITASDRSTSPLHPARVSPEDQSPKRKRSQPSRYLESENYDFRPVKRVRKSRLTSSSPELSPPVTMDHSEDDDVRPAKRPKKSRLTSPSPDISLPATMDHSSSTFGRRSKINLTQSNEAILIIDDDDDDDFVLPNDEIDEDMKDEAGEEHRAELLPSLVTTARFGFEEAEKLLPSPDFPHTVWVKGGIWTEEDEGALQREHGPWAAALAATAVSNNHEIALWKGMIQLFGRTPFDLFRYGLKVDASRSNRLTEVETVKLRNVNMSERFAGMLTTLMCHPVWHNDIGLLRFALQYAVYCRVQDHIYPLPAVEDAMANDPKDEFLDSIIRAQNNGTLPYNHWRRVVADYYYHSLNRGGPNANLDLKELFNGLKKRVSSSPAANEQEKMLFLVRNCDIKAVTDVLDSLTIYGLKKWQPAKAYHDARIQIQGQRKTARSFPPSRSHFIKWKKACFLHEVREKQIRGKLRLTGHPDNLLDYPEKDPIPLYIFSQHVNQAQEAVIRGVIYPQYEDPLPGPVKSDSAAS